MEPVRLECTGVLGTKYPIAVLGCVLTREVACSSLSPNRSEPMKAFRSSYLLANMVDLLLITSSDLKRMSGDADKDSRCMITDTPLDTNTCLQVVSVSQE